MRFPAPRGAAFVALLLPAAAQAIAVTRGPYLQRVSASAAIVRWRTDVASGSRIWWGPAPGDLPHSAFSGPPVEDHLGLVSGLSPGEVVYYAVGDANEVLAGGDEQHRFAAARGAGDWGATRIWVLGDSGAANANAAAVRDGYDAFAGAQAPDLWLMLGDNAYLTGSDAEYQAAVFDMYPRTLRAAALWPALGNHDALSSDSATQSGPYFQSLTLPAGGECGGLPSGSESYFSFESGQIHFVVLDSADSPLGAGSAMLSWLDADLAANRRPWTIALFHHPPYTKGSHDSDDPADSEGRMIAIREHALPVLEARGIDLVLSGHSHGYERSHLVDGHYGDSGSFEPAMMLDGGDGDPGGGGAYLKSAGAHGGTVYVVAGSSSKVEGTIEPHPAMAVGLSELGSLVLDIAENVLDGYFVRADGSVADHFRLLDGDLVFADGFESGGSSAWTNGAGGAAGTGVAGSMRRGDGGPP